MRKWVRMFVTLSRINRCIEIDEIAGVWPYGPPICWQLLLLLLFDRKASHPLLAVRKLASTVQLRREVEDVLSLTCFALFFEKIRAWPGIWNRAKHKVAIRNVMIKTVIKFMIKGKGQVKSSDYSQCNLLITLTVILTFNLALATLLCRQYSRFNQYLSMQNIIVNW